MTQRKRLSLSLPMNLYNLIRSEAEFTGQTINALVLQILWEWAKETEGGRKA